MIEDQLKKITKPVDALFLVGGFSGNEYLFTSVQVWSVYCIPLLLHHLSFRQETFGARIASILRPPGADAAACRGAVQYGRESMNNVTLISSTISTVNYVLGVEIPAEPGDLKGEPTVITANHTYIETRSHRCAIRFGSRPRSALTAILSISVLSTWCERATCWSQASGWWLNCVNTLDPILASRGLDFSNLRARTDGNLYCRLPFLRYDVHI